ncbi:MAG: hypothetical protein JW838_00725 [Spirochaetes bacterium]|nr:hypothetical protein [Spirochaetota bacterium]
MKNVRDYCRSLHNNPPRKLLDKYNILQINPDNKLIYQNVFPCFFTGNIKKKNSIMTISLNPKFDGHTKHSQCGNFNAWFDYCINRFDKYETEGEVHRVFKNLLKIFYSDQELKRSSKRQLLQENLVNIDWCYYYSKRFRTFKKKFFNDNGLIELYEKFNDNLDYFVKLIKPQCIFIHGKSFDDVASEIITDMKNHGKKFKHGKRTYELKYGFYKKTQIPIFYQTLFINSANKNINLEDIRLFIAKKLK